MMVLGAGSLLFSLEEVDAGTPITGDIVADTIWAPSGSPYWIEANVTVLLGVELVILAGTEIRFNGYYRLNIVGRFRVEGNGTDPVIFTHNSSMPSPGDWVGLIVYGEANIDYANISYAQTGTHVAGSFNTINESSFYRNSRSVVLELSSSNLVRNNTFYNSTYCGVTIWQSDANTIEGNNATRNGDTGIWLYEANNNVVSNNTLYRNYWNGIRISGGSTDNVVVGNTILESQLYQGIGIWDSHDNFVLDNKIRRSNNNGVYLSQSSGNNVSLNEISDSANYHGISLYMGDSNVMIGNNIHGAWQDGFYLETTSGNRMYENDIHDNDNGIYMYDCWMNEIAGNNITGNSEGIYTYLSTGTDVLSNNISGNSDMGIRLYDNSNNANIVGNTFFSNLWSGIVVWLSDQIVISDNEIISHWNGGIDLMSSSNVTVLENNITVNNLYGVHITSSRDISVYHNNFVGHVDHAIDDAGSENKWDDGYPSGGNYWDDYTGTDFFSGPGQDQPGNDGIGDEPYVIDPDSQDNYPLMYPFGMSPSLAPMNLDSRLSGKDLENVTLTWNLSDDDGVGKGDVVEYSIFRSTTYHPFDLGYVLLANVTNGTSVYKDGLAGEGNPNSYFYRVCSLNTQSILCCTADQAAKFTRPLDSGPNLISIPLIQSNESIESVLQTADYDRAWYYDSSSKEWKWYMKSKEYRKGLWNVNHTMGMWVNVTENSNLTVAGIVPGSTSIQLYGGWNLVGFPSFNSSLTISDLNATIGGIRVEGFDSSVAPFYTRLLEGSEVLQAGSGYWVKVVSGQVWIVESS